MRILLGKLALTIATVGFGAFGLAASPASAADDLGWQAGDFVVKAGAARLMFDSSAKVAIAGTTVPGGSLTVDDSTAASLEGEYFISRSISAALNLGIPVRTRVMGAGSLAPAGEAGGVKYGIGAAVVRYHFNASGAFSPYLSAGVGHLFIFDNTDGAVANFHVDDAWAPVIQGGADLHVSKHIGVFANASYAPLKTNGGGSFMGAPTSARVTLNPTVIQGGLFYKF